MSGADRERRWNGAAMFDPVLKNPWVRFTAALAGLLLAAFIVWLLLPVLTPVIFAFIVAYCFHPLVVFFERRRIPRMVTILSLLLAGLLAALLLPLMIVPGVIGEADRLIGAARTGLGSGWAEDALDALPLREVVQYLGWAPEGVENFDERAILAERLGEFVKGNAEQIIRSYGEAIAGAGRRAGVSAAQIVTSIGGWLLRMVGFLVDFSLFVFVAVYLMKDYERLVEGAASLVPPRHLAKTGEIMGKIDLQLRSFLRGQLIVCICLGLLYGLGYVLSGVPFGVVIAVVGGAASIVPYVGPTLTLVPAALMTVLYYGLDWHLGGVVLTFLAVQTLESYFLTPRIVGHQVGLNPVWVIVSILVFSSALGLLGMLIAVPVAAVLKVLVLEGLVYYRRSPAFLDGSGPSPDS